MKIISIIIVIAVVILLITSLGRNKKNIEPVTNDIVSTSTPAGPISLGIFKLADGKYSIDPSNALVKWTGRKVILKNWIDTGTIGIKQITFDVKNNSIISNKFEFDMTTISAATTGAGSGQDKLSGHLKSADFFDVAKYPTSVFVARSITLASSSTSFIVTGNLTIKDVTKEIAIPVAFSRVDGVIIAKGSIDIDRTKWNVKYGSGSFFDNLGNNVIDDIFNLNFELKLNLVK